MPRIFKTMNSEQFPEWVDESSSVKKHASCMTIDDWKRINVADIDEDRLVDEFEVIEKCASDKKPYFYNSGWNKEASTKLQEYAYVNQCEVCGVDASDETVKAYMAVNPEAFEKQASATTPKSSSPTIPFEMIDAFRLDSKGDTSYLDKTDWEKVKPSEKLSGAHQDSHGIRRMHSSVEDNNLSPHLAIRPGQNSVTQPDAIGDMAKGAEDTGARLKRENKERVEQRKAEKKEWEREAIKKADGFGSLSFSTIKPIEASFANSGVGGNPVREAADIPEKTDGERLRDAAERRRASIQRRKETDDRSWDSAENQYQSMHVVGDVFAEQLKEKLAQQGIQPKK